MTHKVTRRDFIKLGAAGITSAVLAGCQRPRRWVTLEPYVYPPEEQLAGVATWYASTCRQCPAGCGILVRVMNGRALKIEGNPQHPLNRGKLCARGHAGLQLLYNPDRLPGPVRQAQRGSRQFEPLSWNEAINVLYAKLEAADGAVVVWGGYTMSDHLYDLFQRFAAAVGAPDPLVFDLYSALNGYHLLAEDQGALPSYDLSHADTVLSFGADFLGTWLSAVRYGVAFGEFRGQPLGKRGYLVQLEPRMSITGAVADHWLPIRPGTEGLVAQALIWIIAHQELGPAERVARARSLAGDVDIGNLAATTEVATEELVRLARMFATADQPLAIPGTALTGQIDGAEAVAAVQALNAVAGTRTLSAELPLSVPVKPMPSSFADVQNLVERMRSGEVLVLLVYGANPAYDLPRQSGFREAVANVPFVASFAPIVDETAVLADVILPDRTYLESWGYEVVSPCFDIPAIGSQQPVVTPVFDTRSTADVLLTVARGIAPAAQALPWTDEIAFLKETIGKLPPGAAGGSGSEVSWTRFLQHGGWWPSAAPPAALLPSKQVKAIPVSPPQFQGDEQEYPYFLHLYMSDLLSDGRGASQTWLQGSPDPMTTIAWQTWLEIHPTTAQSLGVRDGDIVRVTSPEGELEAPVYVYPAIRPDTVAIPLGQGHADCGRHARGRGSNPTQLIGARTDVTGISLAWASLRVQITPTGKRMALAGFENKAGVTEGFVNQGFPGE